jgi:hypothetical protein
LLCRASLRWTASHRGRAVATLLQQSVSTHRALFVGVPRCGFAQSLARPRHDRARALSDDEATHLALVPLAISQDHDDVHLNVRPTRSRESDATY